MDSHYQTRVFELKAGLEQRIKRAEDIAATFNHFKREVALASEFTKTGRPMSDKLLSQLEARGKCCHSDFFPHCHA